MYLNQRNSGLSIFFSAFVFIFPCKRTDLNFGMELVLMNWVFSGHWRNTLGRWLRDPWHLPTPFTSCSQSQQLWVLESYTPETPVQRIQLLRDWNLKKSELQWNFIPFTFLISSVSEIENWWPQLLLYLCSWDRIQIRWNFKEVVIPS